MLCYISQHLEVRTAINWSSRRFSPALMGPRRRDFVIDMVCSVAGGTEEPVWIAFSPRNRLVPGSSPA